MRRFFYPVLILVATMTVTWFHVSAWILWPVIGTIVNFVIVAILLIALFRSWSLALAMSVVAGITLGQYSAWPLAYPVAFMSMVLGTRLILQRWIATRSSASLLAAAGVATMIYYLVLSLTASTLHRFDSVSLGPDWSGTWPSVIAQTLMHPIIVYFFWRRFSGGTYARTTSQQPF